MLHSLTRCSKVLKRNLLLASCYTHARDSNHSHGCTNTDSWNQLVANVITFCRPNFLITETYILHVKSYCLITFIYSHLPCLVVVEYHCFFIVTLKSKEVMISLRCSMWNILCLHTVYLLSYIIYKGLFKTVYFCICICNYLILLWQQ